MKNADQLNQRLNENIMTKYPSLNHVNSKLKEWLIIWEYGVEKQVNRTIYNMEIKI